MHFSTEWTFACYYKRMYRARAAPFKEFLSYVKFDTEAIIENNQLIVHRSQRLWVPIHQQGSDVLLRYGIGNVANDLRICSHYSINDPEMVSRFISPFTGAFQLALGAEQAYGPGTMPQDVFHRPLLTKCHSCPTQFQTTFHIHEHRNKSIEVVIDVWQNLGHGRSPVEPGWINCWGRLNPRYGGSGKDEQWEKEWRESDVKYTDERQRDSFRVSAGTSAATHPSSPAAINHWESLPEPGNDHVNSSEPGKTAAVAKIPAWGCLAPVHFNQLLRRVESSMID
ncbi:hypothetical protein DL768_004535 [Monosporascus sp. mg162]|nr:hypothetical protein DL768_004535 [Monosporascus sp. mg162]